MGMKRKGIGKGKARTRPRKRKTQKSVPMRTDKLAFDLWPETGRLLGLSRNGTYSAAQRGIIPTIRVGRRRLVPKVALDRLLSGAA